MSYPAAMGYSGQSAPQTDSKAIVGLVLAIGSWVMCPVVLSIIALILASQSKREIAASGGRLSGQGLNTATKVISWLNIVVSILVIIGFIIFFGFVVANSPEIFVTPFPTDTGF
jgi:preprotein translocase subunit SecG